MRIAFVWLNYTDYLVDRVQAVQESRPDDEIIAVEIASSTKDYDWGRPAFGGLRHDLLRDQSYESLSWATRIILLIRWVWRNRPDVLFICHYQDPAVFCASLLARLLGARTVTMGDSRWRDRPRLLWREICKIPAFLPYSHALMAGPGAAEYLRHFGFPAGRIELGYNSLSVARLRYLAGNRGEDVAFTERPIVVIARLIEKKNLARLLEGYALYRQRGGESARPLWLFGSGPLEGRLKAKVADEKIEGVSFRGFAGQAEIAESLASALCLVLFSTVEQWGMVVAEAIALGIPVIISDQVGAHETLVRTGINGLVVEPDNIEGLAGHLSALSSDPVLWGHLRRGTEAFRPLVDVANFAAAVTRLLSGLRPRS